MSMAIKQVVKCIRSEKPSLDGNGLYILILYALIDLEEQITQLRKEIKEEI